MEFVSGFIFIFIFLKNYFLFTKHHSYQTFYIKSIGEKKTQFWIKESKKRENE